MFYNAQLASSWVKQKQTSTPSLRHATLISQQGSCSDRTTWMEAGHTWMLKTQVSISGTLPHTPILGNIYALKMVSHVTAGGPWLAVSPQPYKGYAGMSSRFSYPGKSISGFYARVKKSNEFWNVLSPQKCLSPVCFNRFPPVTITFSSSLLNTVSPLLPSVMFFFSLKRSWMRKICLAHLNLKRTLDLNWNEASSIATIRTK